jgi:DNA polymerase II large subunit
MTSNIDVVCSGTIEEYFRELERQAGDCYKIAENARRKGLDPERFVEIPKAKDLASRVEGLLGIDGIAERIRELSKRHNREEVSIQCAKEIALSMKDSKEKALDSAIRVGLAILTEGILVAPLEGVANVKVHGRGKSSYASIYYAGPIRSAGGTGQAMSVLIADLVRRELDTNEEIELLIKNCPICIDGEGTEEEEISGNRDLPRVETNRVRGGAMLVLGEGLCLKASKIQKHVKRLKVDGWEFINVLAKDKKEPESEEEVTMIKPSDKFAKDIVAGRPVLCDSSKKGGFRLRYGRSRTTGLAAVSIHPATMAILDDFITIGTQIKLERPGKAGAVTPCDTIEGPIVLLKNGDVIEVNDMEEALELRKEIKMIVDLGEILIPYGEFLENNHRLMPGAFSREWWQRELEDRVQDEEKVQDIIHEMTPEKALNISKEFDVPLHPDYNLFWHDITSEELVKLKNHVLKGKYEDNILKFGLNEEIKMVLIALGAPHKVLKNQNPWKKTMTFLSWFRRLRESKSEPGDQPE